MVSARCVGISSRVSHELHSLLGDRAKAQAVTLSTLVSQILAAQVGTALTPTRATETSVPPPQMTDVLDRLEALERSVKVVTRILMGLDDAKSEAVEGIPCPECGRAELFYFQSIQEPDGLPPALGFACQHCEWCVEF